MFGARTIGEPVIQIGQGYALAINSAGCLASATAKPWRVQRDHVPRLAAL